MREVGPWPVVVRLYLHPSEVSIKEVVVHVRHTVITTHGNGPCRAANYRKFSLEWATDIDIWPR